MKAIILSAGQGRRLLPLTEDTPKCLLHLSGRSLLEWQLRALAAGGVDEAVVVTGFKADRVEEAIGRSSSAIKVRALHNPFFAVADNLASCWIARNEMDGEFLILNGDTLIEPRIVTRLVGERARAAITVTVDRKRAYDADDMKVSLDGDRLIRIGKVLPEDVPIDGESIGFLRFSPEGGRLFTAELERTIRSNTGLCLWYLSAIDRMAQAGCDIATRSIEGLDWGELDDADDLETDQRMTDEWVERGL